MNAKADQSQLRIAFQMMGGDEWVGGITLLRNQLCAIRQTYGRQVALYLVTTPDNHGTAEYANSMPTDGHIPLYHPKRWSVPWFVNVAAKSLLSTDLSAGHNLKKRGIQAYCGISLVNRYSAIPTLSWIPDFQHLRMPEMFSERERRSRDRVFLQAARRSARILLFSEEAKRDFASFAPALAYKARVLNPVNYVPEWVYESDLQSILNLYHLPSKFIYLPNQFWKHKNHEVVFRALDLLKRQGGPRVIVVCSGYPGDHRHLRHFADLWRDLSKYDIRDQVIYVGLLPHDHVYLLMRQSVCVVNPSLFEGWGLTVGEARSLGKRTLLSDIPTHHEQDPKAVFFDPMDHKDMGSKLAEMWQNTPPGPDLELERDAIQSLTVRIEMNAKSFMAIVHEVVN